MCEPVSVMTGLAVGSSILGLAGQSEQARTTRRFASASATNRQEEIDARASAQAGERVKQARAERARLRVAAGEAGIAGVSFEDALFNTYLQEDLDVGQIGQQQFYDTRANDLQLQGIIAGNQGPSALESGLTIAGAAFSGREAGLQIKDTRNRVPTGSS